MEDYLAAQAIYLYHAGHLSVYRPTGIERALVDPDKSDLSAQDQKNIVSAISAMKQPAEFVGRYVKGQGLISNGCRTFPFLVIGADTEAERRIWSHPEVHRLIPELAQLRAGKGFWEAGAPEGSILVSTGLAKLLNKPLVSGDAREDRTAMQAILENCADPKAQESISRHSGVQLLGNTFAHGFAGADAQISGQFSTGLSLTEDSSVIAPLAFAQKFFDTDKVSWISVYLPPGSSVNAALRDLREQFSRNGWGYQVYPYFDERVSPFYTGAMSFVYIMILFFLVLICGIVCLSVVNALQFAFMERRSEVGILLAMGFRSSTVASLFVRETGILAVGALLTGAVLSALIAIGVNLAQWRFSIPGVSGTLPFLLKPGWAFGAGVAALLLFLAMGVAALVCRIWAKKIIARLLENV